MDRISRSQRSAVMASVRGKDTKPEFLVRRLLHRLGYRFRLCRKDLPGKPDVVLPKWKVAVLVHGCFWHQHQGCPKAARPTTNIEFWNRKLDRNVERDMEDVARLVDLGWRVLVVWECQTRDETALAATLESFIREAAVIERT